MKVFCSLCGNSLKTSRTPFCPNCGTRIFTPTQKMFVSIKGKLFDKIRTQVIKTEKESVLLPPEKLRNHVGGEGAFHEIGNRFLDHFKLFGKLKPYEAILDVGCGCGRMAIPLIKHLDKKGCYEGFDVDNKCITWCIENITSLYPNFHFQHVDVNNKFYNPEGKFNPENFVFPYDSDSFDFVYLSSVFTHMLPQHMEQYFSEISRVLKKGGRCFITYFLINPESIELINQKKSYIEFFEINKGIYSTDKEVPEQVIAFDEDLIRKFYTKNGLSVKTPFYYGSWCGRKKCIDFQDIVIAIK